MKFKNRFKNKFKTIFLDPNTSYYNVDEKVNIILSPSLYWVKKLSLPVKYVRDAKKLLPSIFEDSLPDGNYSYFAYKSGDEFYGFAYEDKLILETLADKGISTQNIASIHFAQSELDKIDSALKVNDEQSVYVKDGIVLLVPCCWIEESGNLNLWDVKLSKHKISLAQYGHIVNNSSLYKIGGVLLALIIIVFVEYFITAQKTSNVVDMKDELFAKHSLKSTMMQNRALLKKYDKLHKRQTKIRESVSHILALRLSKNEKLTLLSLKNKTIVAEYSDMNKGMEAYIKKTLKSKNLKFKTKFDSKKKTLHVEINI